MTGRRADGRWGPVSYRLLVPSAVVGAVVAYVVLGWLLFGMLTPYGY